MLNDFLMSNYVRQRVSVGLFIFALSCISYFSIKIGIIGKTSGLYFLFGISLQTLVVVWVSRLTDSTLKTSIFRLVSAELLMNVLFLAAYWLNAYEIYLQGYRFIHANRLIPIGNTFFMSAYIARLLVPDAVFCVRWRSILVYSLAAVFAAVIGYYAIEKFWFVISVAVLCALMYGADMLAKMQPSDVSIGGVIDKMPDDVRRILNGFFGEVKKKYEE